MIPTKRLSRFLLLGVFLTLFFFTSIVGFITDWWWYSEVGYTQVFTTSLFTKIALFISVGALTAFFLLSNFLMATKSTLSWTAVLPEALVGKPMSVSDRFIKKFVTFLCLAIAAFFGFVAATSWQGALQFISGEPFGVVDPLFGKDVGFYIFSLPFLQVGVGLIKSILLLALLGTAAIYFLRGSLYIASMRMLKQMQIDNTARIHVGMLLAIFLSTIVAEIYLSRFALVTSQSGLVFGATYTDATVRIYMLWASLLTAVFATGAALWWAWRGTLAPLIGGAFLYIIVGFAGVLVPSLFQKLLVTPNELVKETPYIQSNITATRKGFALDKIEEREISGDKPIGAVDIANNNLTIKNVRLWDRNPLLSTFSQLQEIRTYYEFAEVDNDRYVIGGEIRQIMLSPRELSSASLPNRNWINERLTFTHGYGMAAGPVNQVTPEGLPVLFIKDLPPKTEVKELEILRPEIYFGGLTDNYVITKTKSREFDYPKGEENVYTTYEGTGGVQINSLLKRIFYAVKFQSLNLLLSNDVTSESRIMYHRTIADRVSKITPFLTFDKDPYTVIADGKVYWISDAYTTSDRYPYSEPAKLNGRKVNYIRNSVKVVVDAYNGSVTMYQVDKEDPIINTYSRMYPGIFQPISAMPASLVSHLRYPEDIFTLQTAMYSIYHMDDPQIFYNKEDQWEIPSIPSEGEAAANTVAVPQMQPRHIIMKLPGEKIEEFVLMLPFTPRAKDNLSSWMVARNDGENYGKLLVYRFPKDKLVFGPKQIIGRINQDSEISQQISLWSQGGSQVIQGPLLVIPVEESLLYVRSLYLKARAGKIPELKRVVVAYENKIAMEGTLEEGLMKIFGGKAGAKPRGVNAPNPSTSGTTVNQEVEERIRKAVGAYEEALEAQRAGDWARYGEAQRRLGEILKQP